MEENIKLIKRWYKEVWDEGRTEVIDELLSPECVVGGLSDGEMKGIEPFKEFYRNMIEALGDINIKVERIGATGDEVFSIFTASCTHKARGKAVNIRGAAWARIKDGKMVAADNVVDFMPMMEDVGLLKPGAIANGLSGAALV